jgi:hypothetical protein
VITRMGMCTFRSSARNLLRGLGPRPKSPAGLAAAVTRPVVWVAAAGTEAGEGMGGEVVKAVEARPGHLLRSPYILT